MTELMRFARYLVLGDSMSIDVYPNLDHAERAGGGQPRNGLGAASLLFRNDDQVWPEFKGRDLVSLHAGVQQEAHASDGATTDDVVEAQLPRLEASDSPTIAPAVSMNKPTDLCDPVMVAVTGAVLGSKTKMPHLKHYPRECWTNEPRKVTIRTIRQPTSLC